MEASTGDLLLYTSDFDTLTIDGDVGEVRLSHVAVNGPLSCATGVGDISVWLVESPDIRLAADTGKIDGTILGDQNDYQITVDCQIGSSSLKDQLGHGEKKLQLTAGVLSDNPLFVLINAYTTGLSAVVTQNMLQLCVAAERGGNIQADSLVLPILGQNICLPCGTTARWRA